MISFDIFYQGVGQIACLLLGVGLLIGILGVVVCVYGVCKKVCDDIDNISRQTTVIKWELDNIRKKKGRKKLVP